MKTFIRKYHVTLISFILAILAIVVLIYAEVGPILLALASFLLGGAVSWILWAERLVNLMGKIGGIVNDER